MFPVVYILFTKIQNFHHFTPPSPFFFAFYLTFERFLSPLIYDNPYIPIIYIIKVTHAVISIAQRRRMVYVIHYTTVLALVKIR